MTYVLKFNHPQNRQSLLGIGLKLYPAQQLTYNDSTKTLKRFKREIFLKTYHSGEEGDNEYNPCMYVPSTWISQWRKIPNKIPGQIKEIEAETEILF